MILRSLTLQNFKQYRELVVDFPEGLIGIVGKNGSGKSSLFEAVLCALYGEIPVTREYLRSTGAGEKDSVTVSLEFEIDGKRYRVLREYRGKALAAHSSLYDFNDEQTASGQKEVTAAVERLVGMSCDAFTRSIFSGQKDLGAISAATGGERRLLIRRMIGMDRIDDIQKRLREDRNVLRDKIKGQMTLLLSDEDIKERQLQAASLDKTLESLNIRMTQSDELLKKLTSEYEKAKNDFEKQDALFRKYAALKASLGKITATREGVEKQIKDHAERLNGIMNEKKEMESLEVYVKEWAALQKVKEKLDEAKMCFIKKESLQKQLPGIEREIVSIAEKIKNGKERIAGLADAEVLIQEKDRERESAEAEISDIEKALESMRSELGGVRMRIQEREESVRKITEAGRYSVCPTCLRPLAESFDATLEKLEKELTLYQNSELQRILAAIREKDGIIKKKKDAVRKCVQEREELHKIIARLDEVRTHLAALDNELREKNKSKDALDKEIALLEKTPYDEALHGETLKKLKELEPKKLRYHAIEGVMKQVPGLQARLQELIDEKATLVQDENELSDKLKRITFSEEMYSNIKKLRDECETRRDAAATAHTVLSQEKQKTEYDVTTLKNELKRDGENRKKVEKNSKEMEVLNRLDWFFDDFRNVVLDRVKPAIAGHAGELFSRITAGRYEAITVDGDFGFFIQDEGRLYPIQRFSGGEVDCANLCLRIAISRTISDLAGGGSIGFLGFDEIFGSQDMERRREIMDALLYLKEMYRQIFIISHIEEIKEEFSQVLHVTRTAAGSKVQWLFAGGQ